MRSQISDYPLQDSIISIRAGISNKVLDDYNREFRVPIIAQDSKQSPSVANSIKVLEYAKPTNNAEFPISPSKQDKPMKIYKGSLEGYITLCKAPNPILHASRFKLLHSLMIKNHSTQPKTNHAIP